MGDGPAMLSGIVVRRARLLPPRRWARRAGLVLVATLLTACATPRAIPTPFEDLRPPEDCPPEICPHTPDPTYSARPTGTASTPDSPPPTQTRTTAPPEDPDTPTATNRPSPPPATGTATPTQTMPAASPGEEPREDPETGVAVLPGEPPPQPFPLEPPPPPPPLTLPRPASAFAAAILLLVGTAASLVWIAWRGTPLPPERAA